jgi:nitrite reductase (NADH) small subunit
MSETKKWVCITQVANIPLREGRSVRVGEREVAIFNLGDRFLAVENRCPHRGGPLADGIVSHGLVVCPLHAWKVDLATGSVTNHPESSQCVKTFPIRVQSGLIFIELSSAEYSQDRSVQGCVVSFAQQPSLGPISEKA